MHYIVMDLEWNQPTSFNTPVFRQIGDSLLFEVIQIGAVKLDEHFSVLEELSIPVRPTHYVNIHPRVRRMTRLGREELCDAPAFPEAMEQFAGWCGEDYIFLTWGGDDISVLRQNLDFFHYEGECAKMYDVQRYYAEAFELGIHQKSLKGAMEHLEIAQDEHRDFHNAVNDAYYTALVLQKLPEPTGVLRHEQAPRKLSHNPRHTRCRISHTVPSVTAGLAGEDVLAPRCPTCKSPTQLQTALTPQAPGRYIALSKCAQHGFLFIKVRFTLLPDGQKGLYLSVTPANRQNRAYIHTKVLQDQYRRKLGMNVDPEDLSHVSESNMPFEDV
ncbi:MAG: exonuclease domain-containing protein [Eubacteriales bacterium]|nr:exonuclease domain-containing protein [Eubacteriales bacterium]